MAIALTGQAISSSSAVVASPLLPQSFLPKKPFQVLSPLRFVVPRCTLTQEEPFAVDKGPGRRHILTGILLGSVATIVKGNSAIAGIVPIPGSDVREQISQKANEAVESAEKRIPGLFNDVAKVSQQNGSGAVRELKGAVADVAKGARETVDKAGKKSRDLFGSKNDSSIGIQGGAVGQAQSSNGNSAGEKGQGFFGSIKESVEELRSGIAQKDTDAKRVADEAAEKFKNRMTQ